LLLNSDNSASSFLTLARSGTGKTLLRCEYYKSLKSDNYLKILILNNQISEYINRYATKNGTNEKNCEDKNCLHGWSENEFGQLLLSILVTEFVDTFQNGKKKFQDTSMEEKIELITIICYYYHGSRTSNLEDFVNNLLGKPRNSKFLYIFSNTIYKADEAVVQIQERNVAPENHYLFISKMN
jgi:hypothetical protein